MPRFKSLPLLPEGLRHPTRRGAASRARAALVALLATATLAAQATVIGGVDFPGGASSFADAVVSYTPVITGGIPGPADRNPLKALGMPDYDGVVCSDPATCTYTSLGQGGSLTLEFVDNRLIGSGTSAVDLWVFEVGLDLEDTFVSISRDGVSYVDIGKVFGATAGIDIDAFGFGPADEFRFVRLIDDQLEGGVSGADIDAVGAVSSRRVGTVPVSSTAWLMAIGLVGATHRRLRGR